MFAPINAEIVDMGKATNPWTLPYDLEPVLEQTAITSSMKINPYQSFAPLSANATIILDVDRWSETKVNWSSPITQRFSATSSPLTRYTYTGTSGTSIEYSTSTTITNEFLSQEIIEGEFMSSLD